ncbi:HesA/MoeB/ThiF family protein [Ferrimonas balearica]|uniref:HesA/MoeB/ThiF family protein n=1 Tax=Ferrimonas balearica TaxID=44012 RepID=UPI001C99049F|nr:HesA/MoeB/ThiF family protein [Ferrimonas balearica]MBY5920281.1 HesA/MoeB/ThiF family protein [Ferrimonas balearica]MBY5997034.1 HesA/MoeB/ThiF family protein [Ferrimonas balearica]
MLLDQDFLRYGRQLLLPQWGESGQNLLAQKRVVIIGLGGLGCPVLQYLAGAGIGGFRLVDADAVSLSNLPRQTLYTPADVGRSKAEAAAEWVGRHNPAIKVEVETRMATASTLPRLLTGADLVLDCTDNLTTRHAINAACVKAGKPLVSGAAIGWQGQLLVVQPQSADSACFACLSDPDEHTQSASCAEAGIVGPVVGTVGTLQALLAIQLLLGLDSPAGLHRFDGLHFQWQRFALAKSPECPVCANALCE